MGQLTGTPSSSSAAVNMTTVGTSDWILFNSDPGGEQRKATGGSQLSTYSLVGGSLSFFNGNAQTFSWTDGTPTASYSNSSSGIYNSGGVGDGYSYTSPADTTVRTLYVYGGTYSGKIQIVASLSDGSASNVTLTSPDPGSGTPAIFGGTFVYAANSASQTLSITWTLFTNDGGGNVACMGAALAIGGGTTPTGSVIFDSMNFRSEPRIVRPTLQQIHALGRPRRRRGQ